MWQLSVPCLCVVQRYVISLRVVAYALGAACDEISHGVDVCLHTSHALSSNPKDQFRAQLSMVLQMRGCTCIGPCAKAGAGHSGQHSRH